MATRIIINGKEVTNPVIRVLLVSGAIVITGLVTAIVIFVLLPIIGIAVTLSAGFIVIFIIATMVSIVTLTVVSVLLAWLFGAAEFRIEKKLKGNTKLKF